MSDVQDIWIGQNNEKLGPFSEVAVRKWMIEGKFAPDALGWRTGMDAWAPLTSVVRADTPSAPPPSQPPLATPLRAERPIAPQPQQRYYRREPSRSELTLPEPPSSSFHAGQPRMPGGYVSTKDRPNLPMPPTLHWGLLATFSILTLGIFGLVWRFVQANWVSKIDEKSKATLLFAIGVTMTAGVFLAPTMGGHVSAADLPAAAAIGLLRLALFLASVILFLVAYFSMAASIRRAVRAHGVPFDTSDFILFFFSMYYIQGQLTWIGHWKQTGQTEPPPPKGILWVLSVAPLLAAAIMAAIAIPAYQHYIVRTEAMESVSISAEARNHVANFYSRYKRYPKDNTEATLPAGVKITGKFVYQVEVDHGKVTVYYDSVRSSPQLGGKYIVFMPMPNETQMTWECRTESSVEYDNLPTSCR